MRRHTITIASLLVLHACAAAASQSPPQAIAAPVPRFNAAGELLPPTDYRSWVFLTSGFAMAYGSTAEAAGVPVLDNVFVERGPYDGFVQTGRWPESTVFVIEIRSSEHAGSIVTTGYFQTEIEEIVAEVKDAARFPGGWGFFAFDTTSAGPSAPARLLPRDAECYRCHARHAAVENTFVQFYPTLFAVARARGTVRGDFDGIPPQAGELQDQIAAHGWAAVRPMLDAAIAKWPASNVAREVTLNRIGVRLAKAHRTADAIALLGEVAQRFPGSASAWNSLAEALEAADRRTEARQANAKGLAALAGDGSLDSLRKEAIERALKERDARLAR